jgi:hypothetical protein
LRVRSPILMPFAPSCLRRAERLHAYSHGRPGASEPCDSVVTPEWWVLAGVVRNSVLLRELGERGFVLRRHVVGSHKKVARARHLAGKVWLETTWPAEASPNRVRIPLCAQNAPNAGMFWCRLLTMASLGAERALRGVPTHRLASGGASSSTGRCSIMSETISHVVAFLLPAWCRRFRAAIGTPQAALPHPGR